MTSDLRKETFLKYKERWFYLVDKNEESFTTGFINRVVKNDNTAAYELYPHFSYFLGYDVIMVNKLFNEPDGKPKLVGLKKDGIESTKNFNTHKSYIEKACDELEGGFKNYLRTARNLEEYMKKSEDFPLIIGSWKNKKNRNPDKRLNFCKHFEKFIPVPTRF